MKSTKTNLIISVLAIALCLSLIAGATFALYQSEAPIDVVVSSAKVDVMATFSNLKLYRDIAEEDGDPNKWLSGKIVNDEPGEFKLVAMAPCEGFTFDVSVKNNSNISVKWQMQVAIKCDEDIRSYFTVTFGGQKLDPSSDDILSSDKWYNLGASDDDNESAPYQADVKLDKDAPVDRTSRQLTIMVTIVAIQANADENEFNPIASNSNVTKQVGLLLVNEIDSKRAVKED